MKKFQLFFVAPQTGFVLCGFLFAAVSLPAAAAPTLKHQVIATLPHDERDFTQGLMILNGELIESTGQHGQSALIRKKLSDGTTLQRHPLPRDHFGEGIAATRDRIYQLTWTSGVAWVYDLSLQRTGSVRYRGQGWGLAFDGQRLLMSDGTERIAFRDPDTFETLGAIEVHDGRTPVRRLNELEYARGHLYANVWRTDRIAVIDPDSGAVRGWHDLSALRKGFGKPASWNRDDHVLNGIAWDEADDTFYLTGKYWPVMFKVRFDSPPQPGSATPQ